MGGEDAVQVMHSSVVPSDARTSSMKSTGSSSSIRRKPIGSAVSIRHPPPNSPLPPTPPPREGDHAGSSAADKRSSGLSQFSFERSSDSGSLLAPREVDEPLPPPDPVPVPVHMRDSGNSLPVPQSIAFKQRNIENGLHNLRISHHADFGTIPQVNEVPVEDVGVHHSPGPTLQPFPERVSSRHSPQSINDDENISHEAVPQLQYFHQASNSPTFKSPASADARHRMQSPSSDSHSSSDRGYTASRSELQLPHAAGQRPASAYVPGTDHSFRGRTHSPHLSVGGSTSPGGSPILHGRAVSASRRSPETRPISYVDLLNIPYSQQIAPTANIGNDLLRSSVGQNAFLLDHKKTLEMYRANVKKTQDNAVQYEFALFMVQVARDVMSRPPSTDTSGLDSGELLREARSILQRLSDRGYPFAQYYLGDGYASGLFNKAKEDYDRAFPLFVAASKHGHAEAGYRAALCYEFGWGCRKDYAKAVQFYRASASRNHPGAATRLGKACLTGDMGLADRYREGLKWLKRAAESADPQYNAGPYELGLLHESGYGPDLFKDEAYAAQLFTQSAELGHPQASLRMGEAYEHGLLSCPKDPALSVHFYNGAAQAGLPEAMMNLCAWYMVGAEPVLEKDENEAYEWSKRAAELGYPKAEYAVGYFTEMGIGCRRDPLEANVWYVRAADQGDDRARQRLAIIRAAASGDAGIPTGNSNDKRFKKGKDDKECIIM